MRPFGQISSEIFTQGVFPTVSFASQGCHALCNRHSFDKLTHPIGCTACMPRFCDVGIHATWKSEVAHAASSNSSTAHSPSDPNPGFLEPRPLPRSAMPAATGAEAVRPAKHDMIRPQCNFTAAALLNTRRSCSNTTLAMLQQAQRSQGRRQRRSGHKRIS